MLFHGFLQGPALVWSQNWVKGKTTWPTYTEFIKEFRTQYATKHSSDRALLQLSHIKQEPKEDMDQFINRFTNLMQLAELTPAEIKEGEIVKENDDRVLSAWFYSGLLPSIYEAIIGHVPPNNLSHCMTEASNTYYAQHQLRRIAPQYTQKDPNAMDVDTAQICRPRMSPSKRDYRCRNRLCFYCRKEGHITRECRQKLERQNNDKQRDA